MIVAGQQGSNGDQGNDDQAGQSPRTLLVVPLGAVVANQALERLALLSHEDQTRLLALVLCVAAVVYSMRTVVHGCQGYFRWGDAARRRVALYSSVNVVLILAWAGGSGYLMLEPDTSPSVVTGGSVLIYIALMLNAAATVRAAERAGLQRASEVVGSCRIVTDLRDLMGRGPRLFRMLDGLWDKRNAPRDVSLFVVALAAMWLSLAGANAVPAVGELGDANAPSASSADQHASNGAAAGAGARPPRNGAGAGASGSKHALQMTPEPEHMATEREPSYSQLCGDDPRPGWPAPKPESIKLLALWLGGLGLDGAGAIVAGCARRARRVDGQEDVWWAPGYCGTRLVSLGVSSPGRDAALLLQRPAELAREQAEAGHLLGASERTRIGSGDFQIVNTDRGDYVLIRSQSASGPSGAASKATSCSEHSSENVRYTVVPPGLLSLWAQVMRTQWVWPMPDDSASGPGQHFKLVTDLKSRAITATATCSDDRHCVARYDGRTLKATGGRTVTVDEILTYAPAAVTP